MINSKKRNNLSRKKIHKVSDNLAERFTQALAERRQIAKEN